MGFSNIVRIFLNASLSFRGATASLIIVIPVIRTTNPRRITPTSFFLRLANIRRHIPRTATIGTQESGLSIPRASTASEPFSPPRLLRAVSHAVMAVPTLAPIITPTACKSVIVPELTKPTTITVVAEDD